MDRFKRVVTKMLTPDEFGETPFDNVRAISARRYRKNIDLDKDMCVDLINVKDSSPILIRHLKSHEVMRKIIELMNEDTENE